MDTATHTMKFFGEELEQLKIDVCRMGDVVEAQVAQALRTLADKDVPAAQDVASDDQLHVMKRDIEKEAVRIISLRQPQAHDLRLTIAAIKMSAILERVGDFATTIAKRSILLTESGPEDALARSILERLGDFAKTLVSPAAGASDEACFSTLNQSVKNMGVLVCNRLNKSLSAYANGEVDPAVMVWEKDHEIDRQYESVLGNLLTCMIGNPRTISNCVSLIFVIKSLERIGDYAAGIAEIVHYEMKGEQIEGERPKGPAALALEPVGS